MYFLIVKKTEENRFEQQLSKDEAEQMKESDAERERKENKAKQVSLKKVHLLVRLL